MTTGTVHTFDATHGTGTLRCPSGTRVPFSTLAPLHIGDTVTFRLVGGIAGLYALDVTGPRASQRQTATSESGFRWRSGTLAPSAG